MMSDRAARMTQEELDLLESYMSDPAVVEAFNRLQGERWDGQVERMNLPYEEAITAIDAAQTRDSSRKYTVAETKARQAMAILYEAMSRGAEARVTTQKLLIDAGLFEHFADADHPMRLLVTFLDESAGIDPQTWWKWLDDRASRGHQDFISLMKKVFDERDYQAKLALLRNEGLDRD